MHQQPQPVVANDTDRHAGSSVADMLRAQACANRDLSFLQEAHDRLYRAIGLGLARSGYRRYPSGVLSASAVREAACRGIWSGVKHPMGLAETRYESFAGH